VHLDQLLTMTDMPCDNFSTEKHVACCSALQNGTGISMVARMKFHKNCVVRIDKVISAMSKGLSIC